MVESYLYNENGTDFNMRNGSFFYSMECYLCILVVKKSALFCLIFPITSRFWNWTMCWFGWYPGGIYLLKFNNRNTRTRHEICSKLTIKTPERRHWFRSGVFIVSFEHTLHHLLVFLLLLLFLLLFLLLLLLFLWTCNYGLGKYYGLSIDTIISLPLSQGRGGG